MAERTVLDVVTWTVQETPPGVRALHGTARLLNTLWVAGTLGAGATGAPPAPDWRLPDDPDAYVGIGVVKLSGRAPWLPPAGRRHLVRANRRAAWVTSGTDRRPAVRMPLETLRLSRAEATSPARHRKHAEARWTLALTDGTGTLGLSGAWLALAFLGYLAGWAEPS